MDSTPQPDEATRADLALADALVVFAPLVRWLLRNGVNYVALAQALKTVFLQEARVELERTGAKSTDSALSVLSGLHRKDVRALAEEEAPSESFTLTPVSKLFTRWVTHPTYREGADAANSVVERLSRSGPAPSFESLAREISNDVHPRTLLEELVRLGLVTVEGEWVVLAAKSFTPTPGDRKAMAIVTANAADHLNAAVHNLTTGPDARFLEQSVFASGLTEEAVLELAQLARSLWQPAFQTMVAEATRHYEADRGSDQPKARMRFGVYYYQEDQPRKGDGAGQDAAASRAEGPARRPRAVKSKTPKSTQ
jgi:hypothetical protein